MTSGERPREAPSPDIPECSGEFEHPMPTICTFFGITIRMYYDDHAPPHFHAYYGEHHAVLLIDTLEVRDGALPRRALGLVLEWAVEHRDALRENWDLAERHEPLEHIPPLT